MSQFDFKRNFDWILEIFIFLPGLSTFLTVVRLVRKRLSNCLTDYHLQFWYINSCLWSVNLFSFLSSRYLTDHNIVIICQFSSTFREFTNKLLTVSLLVQRDHVAAAVRGGRVQRGEVARVCPQLLDRARAERVARRDQDGQVVLDQPEADLR